MTQMERWTEPERATPILMNADVVVVGGGPTGVAAAVGATRAGASAVIIERDGVLGGQAADIFSISPWQFIDENLEWVVGGITRELFLRTAREGGADYIWQTVPAQIPPPPGADKPFEIRGNGVNALHKAEGLLYWRDGPVEQQSLRFAMHQMCEEAGVTLLLDSTLAGVMMDGGRIVGVLIEFRGQRFAVSGKAVVDATGHGDVAGRAGCSYQNYRDLEGVFIGTTSRLGRYGYAGTHPRICNVDFEETLAYMRERPDQWNMFHTEATADQIAEMARLGNSIWLVGFRELRWQAVQENPAYRIVGVGDLDSPEAHLRFLYQGEGLVMQPTRSRHPVDLLDPIEFSKVEADIRKELYWTYRLHRDYIPGFQNSRMVGMAAHVGTAFSRDVAVEYALTMDDLVQGTHFDDVVGRAIGHDWTVVAKHGGFEIPYRALLPKDVEGLLITGKPVSNFIHTSATCGCTGHAAGVAAGLAATTNETPRRLDVSLLQDALVKQGAVLRMSDR